MLSRSAPSSVESLVSTLAPPHAAVAVDVTAQTVAHPDAPARQRRMLRALLHVLVTGCLIAAATVATSLALGESVKEALRSTALLQVHRLRLPVGTDSWGPMWSGLSRWQEVRTGGPAAASPYELALRLDQCKFQYPPSSWLLIEALPAPAGLPLACEGSASGAEFHAASWSAKPWIGAASLLACLALVGVSVLLMLRGTGSWAATAAPAPLRALRPTLPLLLAAGLAGLSFYPLVKGHTLGQLQVFINLALGAALWLLPKRPLASGLLVGLCCLVKPQYLLLLVWGLLRRHRSFAAGVAAVFVAGLGVALARYGLDVHLQFLRHLQGLSQVGEAFWPNQSLNGLLNRLLQTGDAAVWAPASFPAYHPLVRWGTLIGSLVLLAAALWTPRRRLGAPATVVGMRLDLAVMLAALTIASPIAWEHHYGSFLPLFALLLGVLAAQPHWPRRSALVLGVAFVLMANAVLRPDWIFVHPLVGLAGSHLWLGAVTLFVLLLLWRRRTAAADAAGAVR